MQGHEAGLKIRGELFLHFHDVGNYVARVFFRSMGNCDEAWERNPHPHALRLFGLLPKARSHDSWSQKFNVDIVILLAGSKAGDMDTSSQKQR